MCLPGRGPAYIDVDGERSPGAAAGVTASGLDFRGRPSPVFRFSGTGMPVDSILFHPLSSL